MRIGGLDQARKAFSKAVRADLLMRQGQKTEAAALRQEIITSSVKLDGNPQVGYLKLVAKTYADTL